MANYASLESAIQQVIKTNGNNEITGALLQQSLLSMINSLGVGYQFVGIATPSTNPGTPDQKVFYITSESGTYPNFGGLTVSDGEVAILKYNGTWTKDVTGAATAKEASRLGQDVSKLNGDIYGRTVPKTDLPTRNGSFGNPGNVNAVVWLNIPCAGYDYIHFRINKPFAAAGNIYVFSYSLPNGSYHDKVDDDIAKGFYQDDINKELTLSVKGLNSFTIQCYETSLPFSYPSSCTPLRVASFANGEGLEYYLTKDGVISQLRTEVNHIADFTIVNQNNSNLPNFDESSQTLDFGEDPVFYCRGKRYVAVQIWASDKSKYRAIHWPSPNDDEVGPALILVFNADDCTFAFKKYSVALAPAECIVGGLRTSRTSKHVIAHMPFQFTINGISAVTEVSKISKTTSFVLINQNSSTLPNFDDTNKQLDFGSDPVIFCKGQKYQPAVIWSSDTSKFRAIPWISSTPAQILVFKTSDCTFFFKAYTYSPADDEVIIGGIRLNTNNTMRVANVPFLYTINGKNLWLEWNSIIPSFQGRRVSIIPTGTSAISLPNLDTATRTLSFGADTGIEIGGESHIGTANLSVTIPSDGTTAFRIWFDLDSKTLSATSYTQNYPTNSRKVLLGSIRWAHDGSIYADLPFDITFNGGNAGRLYRSYSDTDTPHYYSGEKIVIGGTLRLRKQIDYGAFGTISFSGAQGMTIYDNRYLFRAYASNEGSLVVMDLRNKAILGAFRLASATSGHHVNCINLGEKYDSSDNYPLLYISEAFNAKRCFVERVANDASGSSLVQTITFVGTMPDANNGNSFAVDTFGGRLFMVVHTASHDVDVYVFALPAISVANVNLTDSDVISRFSLLGINNIMQGVVYNNGKLLMPFGYGNSTYPGQLLAIDVETKKIVSKVDLSFIAGEPEDTAIADNCVVVAMASNNIYYLKFD